MGAMLLVWTTKKVRKDTPVLMASTSNNFTLKNAVSAYAIAALPLVTPVPIQDVQLFDYAVAHKSVNSSYGLTASNDDTFIIDKDPYTSDQQRSRDQYEIKETDWNEVAFEEVNGTSTCKLAMHNDWITSHSYTVDGIVNMNLPEQGISGPFKITSIKHIIPQKKPVDEDPNDEWEFRPVTGLFTHHSDAVHTITFSNSETLGVTVPHPIFSTTHNDWRLAGELEVGEKVLTYHGEATVLRNEKKAGSEAVYNLEVKDLHNFLVGDVGVLVHNSYINFLLNQVNIDDFVDEIFLINKKYSNGQLLNGNPLSAINSALYYENVVEQGASIFRSIAHDHMFGNGNKRTAVDMIKSFAKKANINIKKSDNELLDLANKVATGEIEDITEIAAKLIE
ncbi:MAG: tRNA(Glu)-specific nuclease WapA precursor [Bacteroidota bacterium]|jgi:death-on-curing family protein